MSTRAITEVFHAQPICDGDAHDTAEIYIRHAFPHVESVDAGVDLHQEDAERLAQTLVEHLPGGTVDRLVATLLLHQASLLRTAYTPEEAK